MPDTESANLKLIKPQVGGSTNTWGGKLNADMDKIDAWASEDRKANLSGLQTGADSSTITKFDGTNIALDDELLRTATMPLFYAEATEIPEDKPTALVSQIWVKQLVDLLLPVRTIVMWGGLETDIPDGWLLCNGQGVPGADPAWNVPDLRGRMLLAGYKAADRPAGDLMVIGKYNDTAGVFNHVHGLTIGGHVLKRNEIPGHSHDAESPGATYFIARDTSGVWSLSGGTQANISSMGGGNVGHGEAGGNADPHTHEGSSVGSNTSPGIPWFAVAYIMKVKAYGG